MSRNEFSSEMHFRGSIPARLSFIEQTPSFAPALDFPRPARRSYGATTVALRPPSPAADWENVAYLALWGAGATAVILALA